MRERIVAHLNEICDIAYAAEIGSRARGLSTENSDYDVFAISVLPPYEYLAITAREDAFSYETGDGIDITVWDVYKALRLFRQSNMGIIDALQSPIVYVDCGIGEDLRELLRAGYYSIRAIIGHCVGIAKKASAERNKMPKRLMASFLGILRARWAEKNLAIPPMNVDEIDASKLYDDPEISELFAYLVGAVRRKEETIPDEYYRKILGIIATESERLSHYRSVPSPSVPEKVLNTILFSTFQRLYPEFRPLFSISFQPDKRRRICVLT